MRIYVGNLSFGTDEPQLEQLFGRLGTVESVHLVRDSATGRSRGFGFVEMPDDTQARAACEQLDQQEFEGRRLTVNEARPQEKRSGGGSGANRSAGGYGGGGGGGRQKREARW
jgi:RNA recognition motif-containing protein